MNIISDLGAGGSGSQRWTRLETRKREVRRDISEDDDDGFIFTDPFIPAMSPQEMQRFPFSGIQDYIFCFVFNPLQIGFLFTVKNGGGVLLDPHIKLYLVPLKWYGLALNFDLKRVLKSPPTIARLKEHWILDA